uniref:Putative secreted protein n=1 Tax=Anopheles darlingi TaxID=43151 RepID=A0A2M4D1H3_ANODA
MRNPVSIFLLASLAVACVFVFGDAEAVKPSPYIDVPPASRELELQKLLQRIETTIAQHKDPVALRTALLSHLKEILSELLEQRQTAAPPV